MPRSLQCSVYSRRIRPGTTRAAKKKTVKLQTGLSLGHRQSAPGRQLLTLRILRFAETGSQRPDTQLLRRSLFVGRVHNSARASSPPVRPRAGPPGFLRPPLCRWPPGSVLFPLPPTGRLISDATTVFAKLQKSGIITLTPANAAHNE